MLPNRQDPRWGTLVDNPGKFAYNFLALRILMQRVARAQGASGADRNSLIDEVYACFTKNERLMADDIATVFG